jgi:LysM repeat protein
MVLERRNKMSTSTLTWVTTEDAWLSEPSSLNNAQLVANHFAGKWTKNAIAALCGNMRHESSLNPNIWEYGFNHSLDRGYGLVQWTPASKYIDWANANNLDYSLGDSQLARIDYEQQAGIQWIATADYPLSFHEFTQSTASVDYLTQAFIWNYERPARSAGQDSTPDRVAFAQKCFDTLSFAGGGGVSPTPSRPSAILPKTNQQATTYKVKAGDTLISIAQKFNTKWDAIARLNHDTVKPPYYVIYTGQVLKVAGQVTVPEKRYVVRKGDNLSLICRKIGVTQSVLVTKNKISNPNKIFIGQVLKY